jgi:hypothetical protein
MEGVAHIFTPLNAAWCGWTMLFLMLCAVISEMMQPGVISQAGASLRVRTERVYKDAPTNFISQFLITIFRIGTLAIAIYLSFYSGGHFSFGIFAILCGITFVTALVKMAGDELADYTFMLSRRFSPAYEHYANILTITSCILYPCVLVLLRFGNVVASRWVLGATIIIFFILWIYRASRHFVNSPQAVLYFILYICTLEFLPLGLLLYLSSQTINCL